MTNIHPIFAPIISALSPVEVVRLDAAGYENRVRVGNMNRDRLTRELANEIAERDSLPEGKRRDNVTWRISLKDDELQRWIDLVNDAQEQLKAIEAQVAADRALAHAAE